jgi:hypothetical protein
MKGDATRRAWICTAKGSPRWGDWHPRQVQGRAQHTAGGRAHLVRVKDVEKGEVIAVDVGEPRARLVRLPPLLVGPHKAMCVIRRVPAQWVRVHG